VFGLLELEEAEEPIARIEEESFVVDLLCNCKRDGHNKSLESNLWIWVLGRICAAADRLKLWDAILRFLNEEFHYHHKIKINKNVLLECSRFDLVPRN